MATKTKPKSKKPLSQRELRRMHTRKRKSARPKLSHGGGSPPRHPSDLVHYGGSEPDARLEIQYLRVPTVTEFIQSLMASHRAYIHINYFLEADPEDLLEFYPLSPFLDEDTLVGKVQFNSPGFWEMLGNWNPIKLIVDYLKFKAQLDQKERTEEHKRRKLELQNMLLEDEVMESRIQLLRKMGLPDERIEAMLNHYVTDQLDKVAAFQDKKLIGSVSSTRVL